MSGGCVEALRRAGLGLRVVAVKSLRRWVIWWLSESVKVWAVVAAGVCGGAVGGDLWRGGDGIVERVRRLCGRFELPRSRRAGRQQAARFAFSRRWCLLAVTRGSSRAEARTMTRILSRWREK